MKIIDNMPVSKKHEHFYLFIENCSYIFFPSGSVKLKSVINFNSIPIELLWIKTRTLLCFCLIMFVFWTILKIRTISLECGILFGIARLEKHEQYCKNVDYCTELDDQKNTNNFLKNTKNVRVFENGLKMGHGQSWHQTGT